MARTTEEVRELGREAVKKAETVKAAVQSKPAQASRKPASQARVTALASSDRPTPKAGAREQVRAGISGAVDEASFGLADHALAASNAVGEAIRDGEVKDLVRDYSASMAVKRAADAHDAAHYGAARNVGRAVGFGGSVAAMGVSGLARAILVTAPRSRAAAQALKLGLRYGPNPRGLVTAAASGGGVAGVADQMAADIVTGHRSDPLDLIGAAAGGAVGGVTTRFVGPTLGGGAGGAATSVLTDLAHRRAPSMDDAFQAGRASALFGGIGGALGARWVGSLPPRAKGEVGETLSRAAAVARGDEIIGQHRRVYLNPWEWTVADQLLRNRHGLVYINESKMGLQAMLKPRQIQALNQFGDRYMVDYWRPSDVGKVTGAAASPFGAALGDEAEPIDGTR